MPTIYADQLFTGRQCAFSGLIPQNMTTGKLAFYGLGSHSRESESVMYACPPVKYHLVTNPGKELANLVSPLHGVIGLSMMREYNPLTEGRQPVKYFPLVSSSTIEDRAQGIERFTIQDPRFPGAQGVNHLSVILASARGAAAPGSKELLIELKGSLVVGGQMQVAKDPESAIGVGDRRNWLIDGGLFYMDPKPV